jgi:hypothetical protein
MSRWVAGALAAAAALALPTGRRRNAVAPGSEFGGMPRFAYAALSLYR